MIVGSPQGGTGWWMPNAGSAPEAQWWPAPNQEPQVFPVPPSSPRLSRLVPLAVVVVAGLMLPIAVGMAAMASTGHRHSAYRVGECVMMASSAGGELRATKAGCDTDPSFVVAKMTDHTEDCAPTGYDRFPPPSADSGTGRLCLVPNLVVGHCYGVGIAQGVWNLVDCAGAGPATIKVNNRLDTDDAGACVPGSLLPARTYPSPPRTYCLGFAA
jgi:hypothetical protein